MLKMNIPFKPKLAIESGYHFMISILVGIDGVKISHIVLKAWFLVRRFLKARRTLWVLAPTKYNHMTSQWRHNDVRNSYKDVIMTSYDDIFAGAKTQTVLLGFRNLHAKILLLAQCTRFFCYLTRSTCIIFCVKVEMICIIYLPLRI